MKGILFSPEMSAAIREGRKTQTRRLMNPQPDFIPLGWVTTHTHEKKAPYKPGDILYIREEHYAYGHWQPNGMTAGGRKKWKFVVEHVPSHPRPWSFEHPGGVKPNSYRKPGWYKRVARYMPAKYARTFLEVTEVRVQQIQDISEEDAMAEGVLEYEDGTYKNYFKKPGLTAGDGVECLLAKGSFQSLWSSIHVEDFKESWDRNPWVFAYTFKTTAKP